MSNHKWLVSGRRESLPMTRDEEFCQNAFEQIKETISELEDQLIEATDLETINSLKFEITEYKKRWTIVTEVLTEIQGHRDYADDQYFQYIAGINKNADTIEAVAQYLAIDIQELSRNSQKFLAIMHNTRLLKIAKQSRKKSKKREAVKAELEKAHSQIKELNKNISHQDALLNTLNKELHKKNQAIEKYEQMLKDAHERIEQTRSMYERKLQELNEKISRYESQKKAFSDTENQQYFIIDQTIEIWKQQQNAIQKDKPVFAHAEYGLLLATAVHNMDKDFAQHKLRDRSEYALRSYLQNLIQTGNRDYTTPECKQAIAECNRYLRGQHPRQADIESVFRNESFYKQATSLSLEDRVLAFDVEGEHWWWLKLVLLLLEKDPSHEIAISIYRVIRRNRPNFLPKDPDLETFYEQYRLDDALQEVVQSAYINKVDKEKRSL